MSSVNLKTPWHIDIVQIDKSWLKGRLQEAIINADGEVVAIVGEGQEDAKAIIEAINSSGRQS